MFGNLVFLIVGTLCVIISALIVWKHRGKLFVRVFFPIAITSILGVVAFIWGGLETCAVAFMPTIAALDFYLLYKASQIN